MNVSKMRNVVYNYTHAISLLQICLDSQAHEVCIHMYMYMGHELHSKNTHKQEQSRFHYVRGEFAWQ
jgi:hypothetical protein